MGLFKFKTMCFRDEEGCNSWYKAIAVIEHHGVLSNYAESQGHYTCDVKDVRTNLWFRTNDNCDPVSMAIAFKMILAR